LKLIHRSKNTEREKGEREREKSKRHRGECYIMNSFIIFILHQVLLAYSDEGEGDRRDIQGKEIGGTYNIYGRDKR